MVIGITTDVQVLKFTEAGGLRDTIRDNCFVPMYPMPGPDEDWRNFAIGTQYVGGKVKLASLATFTESTFNHSPNVTGKWSFDHLKKVLGSIELAVR
eukprot:SAG11_NODE_5113_length_1659_cov_2.495513_3_plen_97_part_00